MVRCPKCKFGWSLRESQLCRECQAELAAAEAGAPSLRELRDRNQARLREEVAMRGIRKPPATDHRSF